MNQEDHQQDKAELMFKIRAAIYPKKYKNLKIENKLEFKCYTLFFKDARLKKNPNIVLILKNDNLRRHFNITGI